MKKRQIETIIKRDVQRATPDVFDKIDLEGILQSSKEPKRSRFGQRSRRRFAFAFAVAAVVLIGAIGVLRNTPSPQPQALLFDDQMEVFTIAAMTSVGRFEQMIADDANQPFMTSPETIGFNQAQLTGLTDHVALIEALLQNPERMKFTQIDSPLDDYDTMIIFTGLDMRLNPVEFTLHLNIDADANNQRIYDGLVVFSHTRYNVTGSFDNDTVLEGNVSVTHENHNDMVLMSEHRFTDNAQQFTYHIENNNERTTLSALAFRINESSVVIDVHLAESDSRFTIHKTQSGFTQKLHIDYLHPDYHQSLMLRVAFNTETSLYQYQLSTRIDARNIIVNAPRHIPMMS